MMKAYGAIKGNYRKDNGITRDLLLRLALLGLGLSPAPVAFRME